MKLGGYFISLIIGCMLFHSISTLLIYFNLNGIKYA